MEVMRNRNGVSLAKTDREKGVAQDIDYVSRVPIPARHWLCQ